MRQKNWRIIIVGGVMIALAVGFFLFMMGLAPQSTDPQQLMSIVGQVSGVVIGIAVAMIIYGFVGKKVA
jgi:hypothetical protein